MPRGKKPSDNPTANALHCRKYAASKGPGYNKERYRRHKEKGKERYLLRKYGIHSDQWNEMFKKQNGRCYICNEQENTSDKRPMAVDHCHRTGKLRKLLCMRCNLNVGRYENMIELVEKIAAYVEEHK